jgi:hypothetical protein
MAPTRRRINGLDTWSAAGYQALMIGALLLTAFLDRSVSGAAPAGEPVGTVVVRSIGAIERIDTPASTVTPIEPPLPPPVRVLDDARLRAILEQEIGRPCEPARIAEDVEARYRALGYVPSVRAGCETGVLDVMVRESSHRIAVITFDASALAPLGLKAMALHDEKKLYPVPAKAPRAVLQGLLMSRPGDLYNADRYRLERITLGRLGYVVVFIPGPQPDDEEIGEGAYLIQSIVSLSEETGTKTKGGKVNYLGGTAGYGPQSGGSAGLVYQRSDIVTGLDSLTLSPSFSTSWGGNIAYSAPLVAAEKPKRLYDLGGSLFTTFIPNRVIEGESRDERRTGGSITLGARPLALPSPHDLRVEAQLARETVDLDGLDSTDLTLLSLSGAHEWRGLFNAPSLVLRTVPSVEASLSLGSTTPFIRPALQELLHGRFRTGMEYELRLAGGGLDRPVPAFELFTLGGANTVRGFKEDSRLGRGVASLQSELWIPFLKPLEGRPMRPEEIADPSKVRYEPRLARNVKFALFVDGGTVWQSPGIGRDNLYGVGVGIRFVVPGQPLVMRVDYGWGLGPNGGGSYPYFALGYHF